MPVAARRGRLPQFLVRYSILHPVRVLLVWAVVVVLAGVGTLSLEIDTTTDSVLDRSTDEWEYYQSSQKRFGGDEIIVATVGSDEPFDPAVLSEVVRLTEAFEGIPGVRRVDSLASVPLIRAAPDGSLNLDAALADGVPATPEARRRLAEQIRADRIAPRSLLSDDGRVFAVNVILEREFDGDYDALVNAIRAELPAHGSRMSGVPVFRSEANARTRSEILYFVPLTVLAMAALTIGSFRSSRAAVIVLGVGLVGAWVMTGAMGFLGVSISLITMILPSVIIALGCSYVMHVLAAASGARDPDILFERLAPVALPLALSGLTTAIGFGAIGAVRIEEVRNVGGFGGIGVLGIVAATLTVAPAILRLWPLPERAARMSAWAQGPLRRALVRVAVEHRAAVLGAAFGMLVVFGYGITRIEVETDATRWFPPGSDVRDSYEAIRAHLSGISPVNVVLESDAGEPVTRPAVVKALAGLSAYLEGLPDVGKAVSIADPLRQLHAGFSGDPGMPLPEDHNLIEQYLLLLESVEQIGDLVTPDRKAANVVLRANNNGSGPLLAIERAAVTWWEENGVPGFRPRATGIMYEFARAEDEIALGQLRGLSLALLAISVIFLAALRRAGLAILALVPNALPILMVFGYMGLAGVALDAGTVIVGSLALGIAVDDTVHLMSAFGNDYERNAGVVVSLDRALTRVVFPLVLTTAAVGIGFGLLGFSQFTFTRNLGLLIAGTMVVCLVADLILLPALLRGLPETPRATSSLRRA